MISFFTAQQDGTDPTVLEQPVESFEGSLQLVTDKLDTWLQGAIALLPNVVVALIVVILFGVASKLVRKGSQRFLEKIVSGRSIQRLLSTLAGVTVMLIGVFIALGVLQLDKAVTSLLAGAGVVGLALAFAFQDLASNLIAGVYMSVKRPLAIGDVVETNDTFGTVDRIDLRNTVLVTPQGQAALLPNKEIFENRLINHSRRGERRVDLSVGVSYAEDLDLVRDVALDAVEALEVRREESKVELYYEAFGGSSIDLVVRFWIDFRRQSDFMRARSDAIRAIKRAFDEHGITIPFPIRTLDFGIKGGETLSDAWPKALRGSSAEPAEDAA